MRQMKRISDEGFLRFAEIVANAYPGWKVGDLQKLAGRFREQEESDPGVRYWALYDGKEMLGGLRIHDFTMNFVRSRVKVGGLGLVAVDLLRKKEKVARDIVLFCLRKFREESVPLSILYPFRPDFYRKMGWGYGVRSDQYRLKPDSLPKGPTKEHVVYLGKDQKQAVLDCYTKCFEAHHGMCMKSFAEVHSMMEDPNVRVIGVKHGEDLRGYLAFSFQTDKEGRFLLNDIAVREMMYLDREALLEMMTFLRTQADQIRNVVINTQDEYFHFLATDPRNGSDRIIPPVSHEISAGGLGLMYRVTDKRAVFRSIANHNFNGVTCRMKITLADSFLPENDGSVVVHFDNGKAQVREDDAPWDVELTMDIAEFSSMLVGAVPIQTLHKFSLASVSDGRYIEVVDRAFRLPAKPVCVTSF